MNLNPSSKPTISQRTKFNWSRGHLSLPAGQVCVRIPFSYTQKTNNSLFLIVLGFLSFVYRQYICTIKHRQCCPRLNIAGFRTYRLVIIKSNWNVLLRRAIYANQARNFGVKVAGCTQHLIVHAIELINESKLHFHDALQLTRDQLRTRNALMQINFHVRGQRATRSMDCRPRGPDHKYFDFISEGASNLITSYRRPGTWRFFGGFYRLVLRVWEIHFCAASYGP